jgi:hypothetical protein
VPLRKRTQEFSSFLKPIAATSVLLLASLVALFYLESPVFAAASTQVGGQKSDAHQGAMGNSGSVTSTMSMAEMGAMMDEMMVQMASMPMTSTASMSGTVPMSAMMADMGQMMQMMGMMHQQMGQMQMMMGAMMSGNMMGEGMMDGGMMGEGMGTQNTTPETTQPTPEVTATTEPTATTENSGENAGASDSSHPAPTLAATPQNATAGAITIEAVPLATDELLDITFEITLETHSVELDFDLAELATLTIGETSFPAISWTPDAPSGHHVAGTLHFTIDHPAHAVLAEVDEVTLELRDIDGQQVTLRFAVSE